MKKNMITTSLVTSWESLEQVCIRNMFDSHLESEKENHVQMGDSPAVRTVISRELSYFKDR